MRADTRQEFQPTWPLSYALLFPHRCPCRSPWDRPWAGYPPIGWDYRGRKSPRLITLVASQGSLHLVPVFFYQALGVQADLVSRWKTRETSWLGFTRWQMDGLSCGKKGCVSFCADICIRQMALLGFLCLVQALVSVCALYRHLCQCMRGERVWVCLWWLPWLGIEPGTPSMRGEDGTSKPRRQRQISCLAGIQDF